MSSKLVSPEGAGRSRMACPPHREPEQVRCIREPVAHPCARAHGILRRANKSASRFRRVAHRALHALAAAVAMAGVVTTSAEADSWGWSSQGLVDLRARGIEADATQLVPEPERIGVDDRHLSATATGGLVAWNGAMTVTGAGRLFARTVPPEGERAVRLHVDELHVEYAATPAHFVYAGRRHIVHGRSLGVNPLDVALDPLKLDQSKDAERQRGEIEGQDMLGFESLLGGRLTLGGYWTPGERALLAGSFTLPQWSSDVTALVFDDDRPGAGLSLSHTLGETLLAYADIALRRGRDRKVIRADRRPDVAPGAFLAEEGGDSRLLVQSTIGASHTLESGATFDLEYHFDANGYSDREWGEISGLIAENDGNRTDERLRENATGNLLRLNAELRQLTLRRHYGFFRAQHPGLFGHDLAGAMLILHNLEDHSGSLRLRLERKLGPDLFLGVEGRYLYGDDLDEFALRAARLSGSVHVTVHF